MELVMQIRFNYEERQLLRNKGVPSIGLAFPDKPEDDRRPAEARVLNHFIDGSPGRHDQVVQALTALQRAFDVATEQSKPEWWMQHFSPAAVEAAEEGRPVRPRRNVSGLRGSSLVMDPPQFSRDMAANRARQADELWACIELMQRALEVLP